MMEKLLYIILLFTFFFTADKCDKMWDGYCDNIVKVDSNDSRYSEYVNSVTLLFSLLEIEGPISFDNYERLFSSDGTFEEMLLEIKYSDSDQIYPESILDSVKVKFDTPYAHRSYFLESIREVRNFFHVDQDYEIVYPEHYFTCETAGAGRMGEDKMYIQIKTQSKTYKLLFSFYNKQLGDHLGYQTGTISNVKDEKCNEIFQLALENYRKSN